MSINTKPIGVFDSGVGGVSFLKQAIKILPFENFIYFGDNLNAPYGSKTEAEIQELSLACADFLYKKDVKAIVIACNTATSASVKMMRKKYNLPVISIEPAVKPALENAESGKVVVLATRGTIALKRYHTLLNRLDAEEKVINIPCEGLVGLIEKGDLDSEEINQYIDNVFLPHKSDSIDAVVLGCTHYSFIRDSIDRYLLKNIRGKKQIFDGNTGTVNQLKRVLEDRGIMNLSDIKGNINFYSSGGIKYVKLMERLFKL